jgi:hypothetical protein
MPANLVEGEMDAGFTGVGESWRGELFDAVDRTLKKLLGRDLAPFHAATVWLADRAYSGLPSPYPLPS